MATKSRFAMRGGVALEPLLVISEVNVNVSPVSTDISDLLTEIVMSPGDGGSCANAGAPVAAFAAGSATSSAQAMTVLSQGKRLTSRSLPAIAGGRQPGTPGWWR